MRSMRQDHSGFLTSKTTISKMWGPERCWCVLRERNLQFFASEREPTVLLSLDLLTARVDVVDDDKSPNSFQILANNKSYILTADDNDARDMWLKVLIKAKALGTKSLGEVAIPSKVRVETVMVVRGMDCQRCVDSIDSKMRALEGVEKTIVDLATETVTVTGTFKDSSSGQELLFGALETLGFVAFLNAQRTL